MASLRISRSTVADPITVATNERGCCGFLRLLSWALFVVVAGLTAANHSRADSFILGDGREISGVVIQGFSHSIVVKSATGTVTPLAIESIQEVRIDLADETQLVGQLLSWKDGVFQVGVNDQIMQVADGKILSVEEVPAVGEDPPIGEAPSGVGGPDDQQSNPRIGQLWRKAPL